MKGMSRSTPVSSHLAQVNVSVLRHGLDDPRLVSFSIGAEIVRRSAANAPGHIWNEQTHDGDSIFISRSVWESVEAFRRFAFSGVHAQYMKRRGEWFVPADKPNLALWWVPLGETPTVDDALKRLDLLRRLGPTRDAFDLGNIILQ